MPTAEARRPSLLKRIGAYRLLAVVLVVLPTMLSLGYYGAIASDVYVAESRFVIRSPQRASPTGLGALLQGTGFARAQDDAYSVNEFIRSRDALRELDAKLGLRALFGDAAIDPINRFPGLRYWDQSFEALFKHYLDHVGIDYDGTTSIATLQVRAYDGASAQRINEALLQMGERLVNNLNNRSRADLISVAEREVTLAEQRAQRAAGALSSFRSDRSVYDPDRQSVLQLQGVAKLQEELLAAQQQLSQLRQVSPNNPQIGSLASRVELLTKAMEAETGKVTGRGGSSMASKSAQFDRLALEKSFADRQLASALTALESARSEAARKQLYLERLVQPNNPDYAAEPRRIRQILTVFIFGLMLWGVASLILASVREHTD
jgi:capsular polysaccharide transport system permease protein